MTIFGPVIKGLGLGKKLGFPTINLSLACAPKKLEHGVYAVTVKTPAGIFKGAMHYGPRPSIKGVPISLEIHCVGLNEDLYGENVGIKVGKYLRPIREFATQDEFKKQLGKDVKLIKSRKLILLFLNF